MVQKDPELHICDIRVDLFWLQKDIKPAEDKAAAGSLSI